MAVLIVTHDLAVARIIADRIAVMYLGQIVEYGPAETVIAHPAHPYTQALIASLPGPETSKLQLAGEPPSLYSPPTGCSFHPRCRYAIEVCPVREPHFVDLAGEPGHVVDCILAEKD
jgi:peptide/nickel transport system ATP-binding protein